MAIQEPKNFLVYANAGLDDISLGMKIVTILHHEHRVSESNIFFVTDSFETTRYFNDLQVSVLTHDDTKNISNVALCILAPVNSLSVVLTDLQFRDFPLLLLSEYSHLAIDVSTILSANVISLNLGINAQLRESGIVIDPELFAWGQTTNAVRRAGRAATLDHLAPKLRSLLLNGHASFAELDAHDALFLGYTHRRGVALEFIAAVAALHRKGVRNLTFIIPGNTLQCLYGYPIEFEEIMRSLGISQITCQKYDEVDGDYQEEEIVMEDLEREGKTVRIVHGKFDHSTIKRLLTITEPETIATGDQFASEVISAQVKRFAYEELIPNTEFGQYLDTVNDLPIVLCDCHDDRFDSNRIYHIKRLLSPKNANWFINRCRMIATNNNCVPEINSIISQILG